MGDKKPELIILSDKRHGLDNSSSTHENYQNGQSSSGRIHNSAKRYSLSTVKDGFMRITFTESECITNSSKNIEGVFD